MIINNNVKKEGIHYRKMLIKKVFSKGWIKFLNYDLFM